jgi:hypothetical protein
MPGRPRFCSRICKSEFQRRTKPATREWLVQKYVVEGLDCTQISRLVNRDPKSVWRWLKNLGIPTRARGTTGNGDWKGKGLPNPFQGRRHTSETRQRLREVALADGRMPFKAENGPPWKGRGGPQHPSWKGGITPERQAFYATEAWRRAARQARRRDNYICQCCGAVKRLSDGLSFDLHHIVPFECVELRAVAGNLVYLCERCHYWVHSKDNTEGRFVLPCQ